MKIADLRNHIMFFPVRQFQFLLGLILFLCTTLKIYAQDPPQYGTPFSGVPDPRDVNMYQVHIRPHSTSGNLASVTADLDRIKALGTNVIYLMPVYPHGTDSRSSASPYCVKDQKAVGSEYGTLTDLRNLVDGAHSRGMAVIMDFIANQTSWDHAWITQHPEYYAKNPDGSIVALYPDVAKLDFNNSAMRAAQVDVLRYWIFAANIDGYRCDYANNPPLDFWTNSINNLRGITTHKLLMFAEGDRVENFQAGFDLNFGDKWYYDAIKSIAGGTSVAQLQTTTDVEYTYASSTQQMVRYTANHDTESDATNTPFAVFQNHAGIVANFVVSAYMRGVPMLTSGQEADFNQAIPWPYTTVKINWSNTGAASDFTKILNFRTNSAAIRRGSMTNYSTSDVCAFTKISGTDKVVVITNLRNASKTFVIPSAMAGSYADAYTGAAVTLTSGATQSLAAFQYIVLANSSSPVSVTSVSVSPTSASVNVGATTQLTATISPSNATNQTVTWSSSNTSVATVSASGLVTGVATGTANITATTQDGNKTSTAALTVNAAPTFTVHFSKPSSWGTGIKIYWWAAQPTGVLADGSWPGVSMTDEGGGWYKYTFTNITSTNLIFNDGSNQTANLARSTNGWYQNNTWYDSNPSASVAVTGVTLSPSTATITAGGTQQLTPTITPSNATNQNVSYSSNNTAIATVNSSGLVTAVAAGSATITVTTQDGSKTATCAITVNAASGTYYTIKNRWKGTYLYDAGANVGYGATIANNNYKWQKVAVDGTYFLLKNLGTGEYMHIENQTGSVQCTTAGTDWWSAQWSQENIDGTWVRLRNRWQTGSIIHVEDQTGYAEYAGAQDGWYSAHWQLETTSGRMAAEENMVEPGLSVEVYPNPSTNKEFFVDVKGLKNNDTAVITLHDVNGRTAFQSAINGPAHFNHNLPSGLYLLKVHANGKSIVKKLLVD